ncbi:PEP/pyruvate-binding domain-containing protein [Akkermansiaceae bacterium]|nr:PEP/pyruvate-binding domain-containing protein [Akkermansiaceae bacterium]
MKLSLLFLLLITSLPGQILQDLSRGDQGKFQITLPPSDSHYYRLLRSRDLKSWHIVDLGRSSTEPSILSDSVLPGPNGFYKVEEVSTNSSQDTDGDGRPDLAELPLGHALNAADPISTLDGNIFLATQEDYNALSKRDNFPGAQNVREVKFLITNIRTHPELYFFNINRNQHHYDFATNVLGFPRNYNQFTSTTYISAANRQNLAGSLVSHDNYTAPDGSKGIYTLEFWPTDPVAFEWIELAYEIIARNAPFITRLAYHAPSETQRQLQRVNQERYDASSIHTIETDDLFSSTTYQPMNQREAFGRLVASTGAETLSARDIVIFNNLPNDLTYVSGIITEVPQTPLSHVNLKAQQNNTPNAYIADAANHPDIAPLIGQNVFYRVSAEGFEIRPATQQEVEDYFESIRPTQSSSPPRDLGETEIAPLSDVAFSESDSFGGKAANVAELHRLFPNNAPDGFAIPFYFYHEFMLHNRFYPQLAAMISNVDFQSNPELRKSLLANFRNKIKNESTMPEWMYLALTELQDSFPANVTPRLRSSANAEDTTSFNGAGLYDSFTHKPNEGHISKSVKQVWASLWNYRAYEEREFYRINHLASAMGILVHPNQKNEQANGVAVAKNIFDPNWEGYYFNVQTGENLVTNPEANSTPEELLAAKLFGNSQFEIQYIRYSNQVPEGETVLTRSQVLDLVEDLKIINSRFKLLYNERFNRSFAMEIEFKITESGQISIKQARPYNN